MLARVPWIERQYGPDLLARWHWAIQVQVSMAGGRITDVRALSYPSGNGHDRAINAQTPSAAPGGMAVGSLFGGVPVVGDVGPQRGTERGGPGCVLRIWVAGPVGSRHAVSWPGSNRTGCL